MKNTYQTIFFYRQIKMRQNIKNRKWLNKHCQNKSFDIIKEFKLENLAEDKKTALQKQILDLIESRFSRALLMRMSEKDKEEFSQKLEQNQGVEEFLKDKVSDFADIHKQIVDDLKAEMMNLKGALV